MEKAFAEEIFVQGSGDDEIRLTQGQVPERVACLPFVVEHSDVKTGANM